MKKLTYKEVLALVKEMKEEEKKTKIVPHYYKRNGKILERSYPDRIYTDRYNELFYDREKKLLRGERGKIFRCEECKNKVGYFELESWLCDFEKKTFVCARCYEDSMGEDL